ncbi:MAG: serine/threonine-protein phosphatase [Chloroflexi bacterium]|nr:serine/threonine-protein phosphatase [Chloroflexota bacterium]
MQVSAAAQTNKGRVRANNEDAVGSVQPTDPTARERKGFLFVVADGMGGMNSGEVASATAIQTVLDEYYAPSNASRVEPALRQAVQQANLRVHDLAQKHVEHRGMGTTLSVLALAGATAYVAHVGDSRIYRLREGKLSQLTQDHSEVAELVRMRIVTPEMAREHPSRNALTRSIGHQLMLRPDFAREPVLPGDTFLLCSDGVWSEIEDLELAELMACGEPEDSCARIINLCLERECGDNISALVVRVDGVDHAADLQHQQRQGFIGGIVDRMPRIRRA